MVSIFLFFSIKDIITDSKPAATQAQGPSDVPAISADNAEPANQDRDSKVGLLQRNTESSSAMGNAESMLEKKNNDEKVDLSNFADSPINKDTSITNQLRQLLRIACTELSTNAAYSISIITIAVCKASGAI